MKAIIKKSIIIWLVTTSAVYYKANAQPHLCDDPCPPGNLKWITIPLCQVFNFPTTDLNGNPIIIPEVNTVFVVIAFRERNCNGTISFIIEDYIFVDSRNYLITIDPWFAAIVPTAPCNYPNPPTANSIKAAISDAISKLLRQKGNPALGSHDVYFKGACNSLIILSFPDSAFFTSTPDDLGNIDTFYINSASTISQSIPCDDVCCKVSYNWQIVTLSNGETISRWVAVSTSGDYQECESQALPDYNSYSNKLTAKQFDPTTGQYKAVTGNVIGQETCELICQRILFPPPPYFTSTIKSDISENNNTIELITNPIPFKNFIQIDCNREISKIVFYNMQGKVVLKSNKLENGQLNTSDLNNGLYFLQVHFPNNIVKTIKVIKQ